MSCKYCDLKRRKDEDDDAEWIAGEDWESESDDGGYICPSDDGFRMLVYYDARYACTAVDNIKYCPFCGAKLTMPIEPLIKNEKIREAVRAWAEANRIERAKFEYVKGTGSVFACGDFGVKITFYGDLRLTNRTTYEIDDLCGEVEE